MPGLQRLVVGGLSVLVGLTVFLPAATILAPAAMAAAQPGKCPAWTSTTQPPDYILVLRHRSGRVDRVPFKKYVITVMGKEWPSYLPQALIDAGAVATKQYGWWHAMRPRITRTGLCFDVRDGTGDQLYRPGKSRVRADHHQAVDTTWSVRLLKHDQLFMTGYRTGNRARCGHDANGWKLYARSARRCAKRGMNYMEILRTYYGPGLSIVDSASGQSASGGTTDEAQAADSAPAPDSAPQSSGLSEGTGTAGGAPTTQVGARAFMVG